MVFKLLLIAFSMQSCNGIKPGQDVSLSSAPIKFPSPNAVYRRDSMFVAKTVWEFMDKQVSVFAFERKHNLPFEKIEVNVDTIFYSPDTLKLIAFVIRKEPNKDNKDSLTYYYNGDDLKGFRESTKEPWNISPSFLYAPTAMTNYNNVRNALRRFYYEEFKTQGAFVWDSSKQDLEPVDYNYNIQDKHFWDSCILWKKGALTPGYYIFQNKGNVRPGDPDPVWIIPHLDYSDSILKMYK